eukprot:5623919-Ditylum_brightwellii.AAC.1
MVAARSLSVVKYWAEWILMKASSVRSEEEYLTISMRLCLAIASTSVWECVQHERMFHVCAHRDVLVGFGSHMDVLG